MSYVYFLKNKTTGMKYVGVRYASDCHPCDFWVKYFTSSALVKKLIELYGVEDFTYKILHVYDNVDDAIMKEHSYVKLAIHRKDYLNMCQFVTNPISCAKAGKIGGSIQKELGLGIHKQKPEERLKILEQARQIQLETKTNAFVNCDAEKQKERGRKGGPKNKGFLWITDGKNNFKYTAAQQQIESLESFLENNPNYTKGRKFK